MDEDERELFRKAMRGVRRIGNDNRHASRPRKPRPTARFAHADRHTVLQESLGPASHLDPVEESGEALLFRRAGISEQAFRKLRRGQYRVQAEIDLHGLTAQHAQIALREFMAECLQHGIRVVRVIHGKGLRSGARGPVLKLLVSSYLQRVGNVLAFASAREVDGGTGAILVLLAMKQHQARQR